MITCPSCSKNNRYTDIEKCILSSDQKGSFKGYKCYHCKKPILLKEVRVWEPVTTNNIGVERRHET